MAWIESHDDIGDHKKTQQLCEQLDISVPTAVGTVHLLWHYTLRVAWETGSLEGQMPKSIARACHWDGDPVDLISALQSCGFLDGMVVHDWMIYAGELIYQRVYNKTKRSTAVKKLSNRCITEVNPPLPNPTLPNLTKEAFKKSSFEDFYAAYPKKQDKDSAEKSWKKISPDEALFKKIMESLEMFKKTEQWKKNHWQYAPMPSTWLNNKRWQDEVMGKKAEDEWK